MSRGVPGRTVSFISICVQILCYIVRCVYYVHVHGDGDGHIESDIIVYQISRKPNIKQPTKHQPRSKKIQQKDIEYDRSKGKRKIITYVCGAEHPATLCAELD